MEYGQLQVLGKHQPTRYLKTQEIFFMWEEGGGLICHQICYVSSHKTRGSQWLPDRIKEGQMKGKLKKRKIKVESR